MSDITQLWGRIDQNYKEFKEDMCALDAASVYEFATLINAMEEVYFYTMNHCFVTDEEAVYLLQYEEPLRMLAHVWKEYLDKSFDDIGQVLAKFIMTSVYGYEGEGAPTCADNNGALT